MMAGESCRFEDKMDCAPRQRFRLDHPCFPQWQVLVLYLVTLHTNNLNDIFKQSK